MALHDWTRVPAGLFHHFHQDWSIELARQMNRGLLPPELSALVEQRAGVRQPDVLAIETMSDWQPPAAPSPADGVASANEPTATIVRRSDKEIYSNVANRVVVRHHLGRIVAVVEIISPGNKDSRSALRDLVEKTIELLRAGIHVMIVDLFPPSPRDPNGIHKLIWDEIEDEPFEFPAGKDRLVVSYVGGRGPVAYIEPLAVGDPDAPFPCSSAAASRLHGRLGFAPAANAAGRRDRSLA